MNRRAQDCMCWLPELTEPESPFKPVQRRRNVCREVARANLDERFESGHLETRSLEKAGGGLPVPQSRAAFAHLFVYVHNAAEASCLPNDVSRSLKLVSQAGKAIQRLLILAGEIP